MSMKVKKLITKELNDKFKNLDGIAVINPRGMNAIKNNVIRRKMHEKGLKMAVVKNTLAVRAADGTKIKGFERLLDGPSAVVYGHNVAIAVIARLLLDEKKLDDKLELRGAFFDGEVYEGDKGLEAVSKLPTREEAIAGVLSAVLGPGRKLASALKGPGSTLSGLLKTIENNAKDKEGAAPPEPAAAPSEPAAATSEPAASA